MCHEDTDIAVFEALVEQVLKPVPIRNPALAKENRIRIASEQLLRAPNVFVNF
jgi:hypothetical protein